MRNKLKGWIPYLVILATLILLLIYSQARQRSFEVTIEPLFEVEASQLSSIQITKDTLSVELVRLDSQWVFAAPDTGRPSTYRVNDFLKQVLKGQREDDISKDTTQYRKYGLTADAATKVLLKDRSGLSVTAYFGRSPADYSAEFVRYDGDYRVYPLRQKALNYLGATASWWR